MYVLLYWHSGYIAKASRDRVPTIPDEIDKIKGSHTKATSYLDEINVSNLTLLKMTKAKSTITAAILHYINLG